MSDTIRSQDDFLNASTGLFKDNTAGDISAQDLRDFTKSAYQPQSACQGRLTLSTGNPSYSPQPATPSATDTTAETCDFAAAHGWTTGTLCTVSATAGGLTAGTVYYLRAVDSDTVSFHTTLADAEANTNKVNLTASITAQIQPYGVQSSTLRFAPFGGDRVALYDGTSWTLHNFSEISLTLSGLTSGANYDVFLYNNSGTLTLELTAWTSDTARATALTTQDGVYVKSGVATRRYLGTIRTVSTSATEDSGGGIITQVGAKRFVWNYCHRHHRRISVKDTTATWTYSTSDYRQAGGAAGNKVEVVSGLPEAIVNIAAYAVVSSTSTLDTLSTAVGEDSTTTPDAICFIQNGRSQVSSVGISATAQLVKTVPLGYHAYNWLEWSQGNGTTTWAGEATTASDINRRTGMTGTWEC